MPSPRQGRRARRSWPLWSGLFVTIVVAAGSCGLADERPPNPAAIPASSADRAIARAQRSARALARSEQAPAPRISKKKKKAKPTPKVSAEPAAPPPPTEPKDAGAPDAEPVDAGPPDATVADADAGTDAADAGPPDTAAFCERMCDKVIECMQSLVGDAPPGLDEERLTSKLRKECLEQCASDIEDHLDEAKACLEIEDCGEFLDCIKDVPDD